MADRYWVGGTASWDGTAGSKWATTSGGAGGAAVPTAADNVFFDAASGVVTCTGTGSRNCLSLNFSGFTGTLAGGFSIGVVNNVTIASGMTWTHDGALQINGVCSFTSNGKTIASSIVLNNAATNLTLADALNTTNTITVSFGTFTTNNYNVTALELNSTNSNIRTINLGSSTVTLSSPGGTAVNFTTKTNLTFNAGTSTIVGSGATSGILADVLTFYNVSFTNTAISDISLVGSMTFNNLSVAGRASSGISLGLVMNANPTINGTLTLSAGANATARTFVRSNIIGTTRTLTCAAFSGTDIDFRDITIAGAAAPVSGTRLGDAKGNSGITFGAGVTRYWNLAGGGNWSATGWAATSGGSPAANNFPLAQDTCLFEATGLTSGNTVTVNAAYNIGTIDMSARTSNTMTLATGSTTPAIYGNWINGTGTTLTGTGILTFAGRGSQTITSAGKTFTQVVVINNPSGSVALQDALVMSNTAANALTILSGTFDAAGYNVTLSSGGVSTTTTTTRTVAFGSGTWILGIGASNNAFNAGTSTNLTVTGTGTISLTSASAKTFAGGGIQTYPTINQGGTGTLTVTGSNKFTNITNSAIGRVQFTGGTTNEFGAFNLNGVLGNLLAVGSTNTTQATLNAPSWNVGIASTDAGNNTGLSFTGLSPNFLSISYINGVVTAAPASGYGNFFLLF